MNQPGKLGILDYEVKLRTAGKYYVLVRTYSAGTEDNVIHAGIDGIWSESGQRMQRCDGKNQWTGESNQRTEENHFGESEKIYLIVDKPGWHTIQCSKREDGFEFDQRAMMNQDQKWE